jgi:hypothetical protein
MRLILLVSGRLQVVDGCWDWDVKKPLDFWQKKPLRFQVEWTYILLDTVPCECGIRELDFYVSKL